MVSTRHNESLVLPCPCGSVAELADCEDNAEVSAEDAEVEGIAAAHGYTAEAGHANHPDPRPDAPMVLTGGSPELDDGTGGAPQGSAMLENCPILSSVGCASCCSDQVQMASTCLNSKVSRLQLPPAMATLPRILDDIVSAHLTRPGVC